jgi:plasmid stability protein
LVASITIRKLGERVKAKLKLRAAHHGRSMEEEAREILKCVLVGEEPRAQNLAQAIRRHIEPLGGIELALPQRQPVTHPPALN